MTAYLAELTGTFLLILLGNGVVANTNLKNSHAHGGGWIVIAAGWGMAVFVGVFVAKDFSGAHLNPAVTLAMALSGLFSWSQVIPFTLAQMLGAMLGAATVYLFFRDHFRITKEQFTKRNCFCTTPAIRNYRSNLVSEMIGTFVLVFAVLLIQPLTLEIEGISATKVGLGSLDALPVGLLVFAIGLSLGGATGYAINPARDLGPRLVHALLPIPDKDGNDWSYAWVPVVGPILGAFLAVLLFLLF